MKAGVVITTYNNRDHVIETINSVENQTFKNWTCVILDNGSTDNTFDVVQNYIGKNKNFKAFRKTINGGPSGGRNLGYSKLPDDIDYIHFLDGDDLLKPKYLECLLSYLEKHPEVGLAACQFEEIDANSSFLGKGHRSRYVPSFLGLPKDLPLNKYETPFVSFFSSTGMGPFGVYRRNIFEKTNGYVLESQEDTDMFCQMSLLAKVHYLPKYLYKKRVHNKNFSKDITYVSKLDVFRAKWDFYYSLDDKINEQIIEALKYYYTLHKPFRDFKVSIKAFKEFIKYNSLSSLKWSWKCLKNGIKDLFLRQNFKIVMKERQKRFNQMPDQVLNKTL